MGAMDAKQPCDKCNSQNDQPETSNYCTACASAYHERVAASYETRPIAAKTHLETQGRWAGVYLKGS